MSDIPIPVGSRDTLKLEIRGQNLTGVSSVAVQFRDPDSTAGTVLGTASGTLATASGTGAGAYSEIHCTPTNWQAVITSGAADTYQVRGAGIYPSGPPWYTRWRYQQFVD